MPSICWTHRRSSVLRRWLRKFLRPRDLADRRSRPDRAKGMAVAFYLRRAHRARGCGFINTKSSIFVGTCKTGNKQNKTPKPKTARKKNSPKQAVRQLETVLISMVLGHLGTERGATLLHTRPEEPLWSCLLKPVDSVSRARSHPSCQGCTHVCYAHARDTRSCGEGLRGWLCP